MEKMIAHQQRTGWGDIQKAFGADDEQPEAEEGPDAMEKFYHDAILRGYGIDAEKIRAEIAPINKRATEILAKTRAAGIAPTPATKVARTIRTEFPASGKCVVAELDESGAVIRTYTEGE